MENYHPHEMPGSSLTDWHPVLIIGFIAAGYIWLLLRLRNKEKNWRLWRSISFMTGILLLCFALSPGVMEWGHVDMRGHMVQHLLIAMFAPIFIVLGAPLTLALKSLSVEISRKLTSFMKTGFFKIISHPVSAFILNTGGMYLLYLTPLYNLSLNNPFLHYFIHLHFFAAGYLFTWAMIGPDPAPEKPGLRLRVLVLFLSMAAHAFLSKLMYAYLLPFNSPHSAEQIREGAKLMYYWGDLSELVLAIVLFTGWYRNRSRREYRIFPR